MKFLISTTHEIEWVFLPVLIMFYSSLGIGWIPVCSFQRCKSPLCFRDCVCSSWTVTGWCLTDTPIVKQRGRQADSQTDKF